jgi:dCTP diphosphatase
MADLDVSKMQKKIQEIVEARDWDQFHTPKNMAISLSLEASELLENFQWLKEGDAIPTQAIADEMADVLYWLLRMSDVLKIDLDKAFWEKIKKSEAKYPVELAKGNAKKYTEF